MAVEQGRVLKIRDKEYKYNFFIESFVDHISFIAFDLVQPKQFPCYIEGSSIIGLTRIVLFCFRG